MAPTLLSHNSTGRTLERTLHHLGDPPMGRLEAKEELCKTVSAPPPEDPADLCREACLGQ